MVKILIWQTCASIVEGSECGCLQDMWRWGNVSICKSICLCSKTNIKGVVLLLSGITEVSTVVPPDYRVASFCHYQHFAIKALTFSKTVFVPGIMNNYTEEAHLLTDGFVCSCRSSVLNWVCFTTSWEFLAVCWRVKWGFKGLSVSYHPKIILYIYCNMTRHIQTCKYNMAS